MQNVKSNEHVERVIHGRGCKRKRYIRLKLQTLLLIKNLNAIVILEKLPKQCSRNVIRDIKDSILKHRIHQVGFKSIIGC